MHSRAGERVLGEPKPGIDSGLVGLWQPRHTLNSNRPKRDSHAPQHYKLRDRCLEFRLTLLSDFQRFVHVFKGRKQHGAGSKRLLSRLKGRRYRPR
jgi:hypothetical protein